MVNIMCNILKIMRTIEVSWLSTATWDALGYPRHMHGIGRYSINFETCIPLEWQVNMRWLGCNSTRCWCLRTWIAFSDPLILCMDSGNFFKIWLYHLIERELGGTKILRQYALAYFIIFLCMPTNCTTTLTKYGLKVNHYVSS